MLFITLMFQALSFWTAVTPLSLDSSYYNWVIFFKENIKSETCLSWGVTDLVCLTMLFITLMFQALSFWTTVTPLSMDSSYYNWVIFFKENINSETCLSWRRYRFGIRDRLRFSLWDMDYGVKILRKLVSEEWKLLWYHWRFVTIVMSATCIRLLWQYSSLLQCVYSLISSSRFDGDSK